MTIAKEISLGRDGEKKKMAWVNWDLICTPKARGGLSIKNLEVFNLALLTKWRWRFLIENESSLWKKLLVERYGSVGPWFDEEEYLRRHKTFSIWWRDITLLGNGTTMDFGWFNNVVRKKMGKGDTVSFWSGGWLGRDPLSVLFPSLFSGCDKKEASVSDMGSRIRNGWC